MLIRCRCRGPLPTAASGHLSLSFFCWAHYHLRRSCVRLGTMYYYFLWKTERPGRLPPAAVDIINCSVYIYPYHTQCACVSMFTNVLHFLLLLFLNLLLLLVDFVCVYKSILYFYFPVSSLSLLLLLPAEFLLLVLALSFVRNCLTRLSLSRCHGAWPKLGMSTSARNTEVAEDGPLISGLRDQYELNEQLDVNCTSPSITPPNIGTHQARLVWRLNSQTVGYHPDFFLRLFIYTQHISLRNTVRYRQERQVGRPAALNNDDDLMDLMVRRCFWGAE